MPNYSRKSQSYKKSKNGGRRRKHTMRKLRRGKKSRKVMRGGQGKEISSKQLEDQLNRDGVMTQFLKRYFKVQEVKDIGDFPGFDDFQNHYNIRYNQNKADMYGKFNTEELNQRLALNEGQKDYDENDLVLRKIKIAILSLAV